MKKKVNLNIKKEKINNPKIRKKKHLIRIVLKSFSNIIITNVLIFKLIFYLSWVKTQNLSQLMMFFKPISYLNWTQA